MRSEWGSWSPSLGFPAPEPSPAQSRPFSGGRELSGEAPKGRGRRGKSQSLRRACAKPGGITARGGSRVSCRMPLVDLQQCTFPNSPWHCGAPRRVDFDRVARLVGEGEVGEGGTGTVEFVVDGELSKIVYVRAEAREAYLASGGGRPRLILSSEDILWQCEPALRDGLLHSSDRLGEVLRLAQNGKISLHPRCEMSEQGELVQFFQDAGMKDSDWQSLGFSPPTGNRPALDRGSGTKRTAFPCVRIPHPHLPDFESRCHDLWGSYVESDRNGALFREIMLVEGGGWDVAYGLPKGSLLTPASEFLEGELYVRTGDLPRFKLVQRAPGARRVVSERGITYVSVDPLCASPENEIPARWKHLGRTENGVFAHPGRYAPIQELRSSHYIPPRTKTCRVWETGAREPVKDKCALAAVEGRYVKRPPKGERKRLSRLYGAGAVPANFQQYTEVSFSQKSRLLQLVRSGDWVFIPNGGDGDAALAQGYEAKGLTPPISWRIHRCVAEAGDIETDPMGGGIFARLLPREEVYGNTVYFRKLVRQMRVDGWGFLAREILENSRKLRQNLLEMAIS